MKQSEQEPRSGFERGLLMGWFWCWRGFGGVARWHGSARAASSSLGTNASQTVGSGGGGNRASAAMENKTHLNNTVHIQIRYSLSFPICSRKVRGMVFTPENFDQLLAGNATLKDGLFFGSPTSGQDNAILYSLIETCRKLDPNPADRPAGFSGCRLFRLKITAQANTISK